MFWCNSGFSYRRSILEPEKGIVFQPEVAILPFLIVVALSTYIEEQKRGNQNHARKMSGFSLESRVSKYVPFLRSAPSCEGFCQCSGAI